MLEAESPAAPLMQLMDVSKTYRMGDVGVPVLHDVNLAIPRGCLMVIVGPSGSGKSTLMNLIGGIDAPTSGTILFGGRDITGFTEKQRTRYRRDNVGFVFQFYNLTPTLTAEENAAVATELCGDAMPPREVLQLVGMAPRATHFPAQLSGGEQQRTAIARAVAKGPQLLLCDEPTGALDLTTGRMVLSAIVDLNDALGMTVIIITHNSAIAAISDFRVRLGSGTIVETVANDRRTPPQEIVW
ncbi:MAG: ABC transporter ATP-binding protein [Planctomycetaceae bacterium]